MDNKEWKQEFGMLLKKIFEQYSLDHKVFAKEYHWSESTIRYWFLGKNLPQPNAILNIKKFLYDNIPNDFERNQQMNDIIKMIFTQKDMEQIYYNLKNRYHHINEFVGEILSIIYHLAKNKSYAELYIPDERQPTGKTQVVVFAFEGTLTFNKTNKTVWESLWTSLDYDKKECQELHSKYNRNEITHEKWCKLTEMKFTERNLHKGTVEDIASKIKLIKGVRETFQELQNRDIKIYIVSGSIATIIRSVLNTLCQYTEEIKANQFRFNQGGYLTEIIGTKYDFEGKARFITEIAEELKISAKDILFVGSSLNDRFAYASGARTLCINPKLVDITNLTVWNNCIQTCENLKEVLQYL